MSDYQVYPDFPVEPVKEDPPAIPVSAEPASTEPPAEETAAELPAAEPEVAEVPRKLVARYTSEGVLLSKCELSSEGVVLKVLEE